MKVFVLESNMTILLANVFVVQVIAFKEGHEYYGLSQRHYYLFELLYEF